MREEDTVCVGSDGLQYCKVCGEAKEAFFPEGGFMGMKKHSRQCACDRKAYEEEQKYFKDKEHRELVSRNTSICFDESRMEEWTFENADMSDASIQRQKSLVITPNMASCRRDGVKLYLEILAIGNLELLQADYVKTITMAIFLG